MRMARIVVGLLIAVCSFWFVSPRAAVTEQQIAKCVQETLRINGWSFEYAKRLMATTPILVCGTTTYKLNEGGSIWRLTRRHLSDLEKRAEEAAKAQATAPPPAPVSPVAQQPAPTPAVTQEATPPAPSPQRAVSPPPDEPFITITAPPQLRGPSYGEAVLMIAAAFFIFGVGFWTGLRSRLRRQRA